MRPEIDRLDGFDRHVAETGSLAGSVVQGLDLRDRAVLLRGLSVSGAVFLGCRFDDSTMAMVVRNGALVQPDLDGLPFHPYRTALYTPAELFDGYQTGVAGSLASTLDSRVYRWSRAELGLVEAMAKRLHDASIDDALAELLDGDSGRGVVAIMGGHSLGRDEPRYADVVRLARRLTREGLLVASGGGPGAMEATNLGGWLAPHPDDDLDRAIAALAAAPRFEPVDAWLDAACAVLGDLGSGDNGPSLGVPTWHYGHEPPNVFASSIAKYFDNSIREDGLLAIAGAGVVFAPGSAGTVQEVFQDAAQNHYETFDGPSPMVFLDTDYWTNVKPVYPLLVRLAADRPYGRLLAIHDDIDAIVDHLLATR